MFRKILIVISFAFFVFPGLSLGEEYAFSPVLEGSNNTESYFNKLGIPGVWVTRECSDNKKTCWPVIVNHKGDTLKSFYAKDSVSLIASGRYRKFASALVKYSWESDDKYHSKVFLINDSGRKTIFSFSEYDRDEVLSKIISENNNLVILTSSSIVTMTNDGTIQTKALSSSIKLTKGLLRNNPDGEIAVIAVSTKDKIVLGNLESQSILPDFTLSRHGDKEDILGVYPASKNITHGVVYKYVNEYCKGLFYVERNLYGEHRFRKGWIFNSEDRNIGWKPDIYSENGGVIISSTNSSDDKKVHFRISNTALNGIENNVYPSHLTKNLCQEKGGSFLMGGGISNISWIASSKVEKDDKTYLDVDYDISDSLFYMAQFEGRIGDTRLTMTYLRHKAKEIAEDKPEEIEGQLANYFLKGGMDFYGLLSKSSSLRLVLEKSQISGIAKVKIGDALVRTEEFESKYDRYAALAMREKGLYYGFQYEKYAMPSAIGFSNKSKRIVYSELDPEFGIEKASLLFGYDELAYSKRYETNYQDLYFAGNIGVGLAWLSVSDNIEKLAKSSTGKSDIDVPVAFTFDGMMEFGYLWQRRFKKIKGFGYTFNIGYRAKGVYMRAGQSEGSKASSDGLALEFDRYDVLHGPFAQLNLIW